MHENTTPAGVVFYNRGAMRRRASLCTLLLGMALLWPRPVLALDERSDDLSASVEVAETFSLSLSNPHLAFHQLSPGNTEVLGEGHFFNEVLCRSNTGRAWYLKAQLVSLQHLGSSQVLPASSLEWSVVESTGQAEPMGGRHSFQPFAEQPLLLYESQGDDARGREVALRFQYRLSAPMDTPAGDYAGQLMFTMTESP